MTTENQEKALPFFCIAAFAGLCFALIPWACSFWEQAINSDIAFLTLAAGRMLDGIKMSEGYYDTNLPLSIIVYIPPAALAKYASIPLYYATTIYSFTLLAISLIATGTLLKYFKELTIEHRVLILGAFLLANTIHAGYDFGQKDQFIGMALFPLVLAQILITRKTPLPPILKHCVLAAGGFFILIKPHYGLIPAAIFIHRSIKQNRITVFKDPDSLWLAGMAAGYIAVLFIFFSDFLTIILPDIITYYASDLGSNVVLTGIVLIFQAIIIALIPQLFMKKAPGMISVFSLIAALCFVPFIIQGKGWAYHALPADMFLFSALILLMGYGVTAGINILDKNKPHLARIAGFALPTALLFVSVAQNYAKLPIYHLTHEDYKNTKFAKRIDICVNEYGKECTFIMPTGLINISKELSIYTGVEHATRFSHIWFIPRLLSEQKSLEENRHSPLTQEELDAAVYKYMKLTAEDFERYDPKLVFIAHVPSPADPDELFDLRSFMLDNAPEIFEPIWDRYELEESLDVDRINYMIAKLPGEDLIRYDIYRKKKEQPPQ